MKRFSTYIQFIALFLMLEACAPKIEDVYKECVVNSDQTGTFKGHWLQRPVPLAVEAVDFSASELVEIEAAIGKWNNFYNGSKGFKLYLVGTSPLVTVNSSGVRLTKGTVCSQTIVSPSGFSNTIKIYKTRTGWPYGSQVMALTSLCPIPRTGQQFRELVGAVMEVNYQDYFTTLRPDLQSIVVHELGHVLGLDHSCLTGACTNIPTEYIQALMYPSLGFDGVYGRIKREINMNDQQRANCLY